LEAQIPEPFEDQRPCIGLGMDTRGANGVFELANGDDGGVDLSDLDPNIRPPKDQPMLKVISQEMP
jgi:hypothetical protein